MHGDRARETIERAIRSDLDRLKFAKKAVKLNASLASEAAKVVREIEGKKRAGLFAGEARAKEASARRTAQETSPTKRIRQRDGRTRKVDARHQSKKNDYYAVLSVERTATDSEIKKAYRKLAVKIHPDKCQGTGAEEAFKIVSKAFACLSDSEKRAATIGTSEEGPQGMSGMKKTRGPDAFAIWWFR